LNIIVYSLVDITDEILDVLMELVYQLLCQGQLMLAKLLRNKVLSKYEHRKSSRSQSINLSIANLQSNSRLVYRRWGCVNVPRDEDASVYRGMRMSKILQHHLSLPRSFSAESDYLLTSKNKPFIILVVLHHLKVCKELAVPISATITALFA